MNEEKRNEVISMIRDLRRCKKLNSNIVRKTLINSFIKGLMCIFYIREAEIFPTVVLNIEGIK